MRSCFVLWIDEDSYLSRLRWQAQWPPLRIRAYGKSEPRLQGYSVIMSIGKAERRALIHLFKHVWSSIDRETRTVPSG